MKKTRECRGFFFRLRFLCRSFSSPPCARCVAVVVDGGYPGHMIGFITRGACGKRGNRPGRWAGKVWPHEATPG
jgi:hypothetical protein